MKNAIIVHGMPSKEEYYSDKYPSGSNSHWMPWLQKQLIINDIKADTLEVPHAYHPQYDIWKREFERFDITTETILVGHSCGAGFLLRWLSQHPEVKVGKVALVAPWLDPARTETTNFFDFEMDSEVTSRTAGITFFESDNDDVGGVALSIKLIKEKISDTKHVILKNHGHFCFGDMGTEQFPELLNEIIN